VADKFGRFLHDRRQIFVGRFYRQTKLANFIVRLTSRLRQQASSAMLELTVVCVTSEHCVQTAERVERLADNRRLLWTGWSLALRSTVNHIITLTTATALVINVSA